MLGQRRRLWTNIQPALGQILVFAGFRVGYEASDVALVQCWAIVIDSGPTLYQPLANLLFLLA